MIVKYFKESGIIASLGRRKEASKGGSEGGREQGREERKEREGEKKNEGSEGSDLRMGGR